MVTGIDSSLLLSLYQSRASLTAATTGSSALATAANIAKKPADMAKAKGELLAAASRQLKDRDSAGG